MTPAPNDRKVLVIGWDAADWRVIRPMLAEDKLPNLKKFMAEGVSGNNATLHPPLSPMLWTSIATGKRPFKHGIHGFSEPTPDGKSVRPITNVSRSCKAIWNILTQLNKKTNVVGWWPSHPAEPINGVMVSNWYQTARNLKDADIDPTIGRPKSGAIGWTSDQWPMAEGTVHPMSLAKNLQEFRFHPMELDAEHIAPFVPNFKDIDQKKDKRLVGLAKTLADTVSVHGAATAIMQLEPWDFMAVYYDGIDHFSHGFMKYHKTKQDWIQEKDFELYKDVVEGAYRFHDLMLGTLVELAGEEATIILLSDHGFHPDALRPATIPSEPAGPAIEHRTYGVFMMKGPGIRKGETIQGASVLDLCPTVLALYDLPVGDDMDGKPLVTCFEELPEIKTIPTWEDIDGACGMHPPEAQLNSVQSAEAIKQLVELGYIEELNENAAVAVSETMRELQYNLAQSMVDGGLHAAACEILGDLWREWPDQHRFGLNHIACLAAMGRLPERADAIQEIRANMSKHQLLAIETIDALREEAETYGMFLPTFKQTDNGKVPVPPSSKRDNEEEKDKEYAEAPKKLQAQVRRTLALLGPFNSTLTWLAATQAIAEGFGEQAIPLLDEAASHDSAYPDEYNQVGQCFLQLKEWKKAQACFEKAMATDDENASANLGMAIALQQQDLHDAAIDHALSATELLFANPIGHFTLGVPLVAVGEHETARTAFGTAISQAPNFLDAHLALANLLESSFDEADQAATHREFAARLVSDASAKAAAPPTLDDVQTKTDHRRATRKQAGGNDADWSAVAKDDIITIVSGLPRSGTSMMMQMIDHGGLPPFTDGAREADADNPKGYYEHLKATQLARDQSWLPDAKGKCVKIVAQLLPLLPDDQKYRVIFMDRDLREIARSQRVMLDRLGKEGSRLDDVRLMKTLDHQVAQIELFMHGRTSIQCLFVNYADVLNAPAEAAARLNAFLGGDFDETAMTAAVEPSLRRQRSNEDS